MSSNRFPSNPLPFFWETFQTLQDALRTTERAMRSRLAKDSQCQPELLHYQKYLLNHNRSLQVPEQPNAFQLITDTRDESWDLFILGLWATFERFLRSYLQHKGEALKQTVTPPNLADSLYQHFAKGVEYWKPTEMLDFLKDSLFATAEGRKSIGLAKQLLEYRDWVAHGKNLGKLPSAPYLEPKNVYACLNEIVTVLLTHYP
jgi:hypothetical protein